MAITLGYTSANGLREIHRNESTVYDPDILGLSTWSPASATMVVGDYIVFQQDNDRGGRFNKLIIDVATAVVATTFTGVWELCSPSGTYSNPNWVALTNVVDGTNGFTTAGTALELTFDLDDVNWGNYANPYSGTTGPQPYHYAWNIRFRITGISGVTNNGSVTKILAECREIVLDGANTYTMQDIYDEDVLQGWGLVTKDSESTYLINSGLRSTDAAVTFVSKNEQIIFKHNYSPYLTEKCLFGELINNEAVNGTYLIIESDGASFINRDVFGRDSSVYDSVFKIVKYGAQYVQGFWGGGVGEYTGQLIGGSSFIGWRNYTFKISGVAVKNLILHGGGIENATSSVIDCVSKTSTQGITQSNVSNGELHRHDLSTSLSREVYVYKATSALWGLSLIDCKYSSRAFENKVYWAIPNSMWSGYLDLRMNFKVSLGIFIKDEAGNAIDGADIKVYDKNNTLYDTFTSFNGYVGYDKRILTSATSTSVTFTGGFDGSAEKGKEFIVISGSGVGSRSVISVSTLDSFTYAEILNSVPIVNDEIIMVPYVTFGYDSPLTDTANDYSIYTENTPFRIVITKQGYDPIVMDNEPLMEKLDAELIMIPSSVVIDQEGML